MGYSCRIFRILMPAAKWGLVGLHMPSRRLAYAILWACICHPVRLHLASRMINSSSIVQFFGCVTNVKG